MKHEYPKILYHPCGNYSVIVNDDNDELNVRSRWALDDEGRIEFINMSVLRDLYLARALKANLQVDSSWTNYQFERALEKAEH